MQILKNNGLAYCLSLYNTPDNSCAEALVQKAFEALKGYDFRGFSFIYWVSSDGYAHIFKDGFSLKAVQMKARIFVDVVRTEELKDIIYNKNFRDANRIDLSEHCIVCYNPQRLPEAQLLAKRNGFYVRRKF